MDKKLAEFLCEVANNADMECEIKENYSGRGMYGDTTTGLVTEYKLSSILLEAIQQILYEIDDEGEYEDINFDAQITSDSMGKYSSIYY